MKRSSFIAEMVKERDAALLSLDKERILAFYRKYNGEVPATLQNDSMFWISTHKAITADLNLPIEFRRKSKAWLAERGYRSLDDGDL